MWGAFVTLFRFFSVTLKNFVMDHLHLVLPWFSFFYGPIKSFVLDHHYLVLALLTIFSFHIKNFLWDHFFSVLPIGSNVKALTREFNILKASLKDVEDQIQIQIQKDDVVKRKATEEVEGWMKRVKDLQPTVESIITDYDNRGYFSNVYSISMRAVNKLKELRQEAEFKRSVRTYTKTVPLPSVQGMPVTPIKFGQEMFESRLQEALNFLKDDEHGVLGIWGMGGVGKTTLLEHINNNLGKDPSSFGFDKVVFLTASRECTTEKIQKELLKKLGLPQGDDDRSHIFDCLSNKSFAILLDDLWEHQDLKEVGVPLHLELVGEHNVKRKVILTTRSHLVCCKMDAQARHIINVECLSTEDARLLFRYNAGVDATMIESNPLIGELADKVADECGGLPIALITTGKALAGTETVQVWENALQLLKKSKNSQIPGMDDPLPLLKVSYDHLKDPRMKECLLHCALWPEDSTISKDELIHCWMGHDLLGKFDRIREAYRTGHAIIDSLLKVCLLENVKVDENTIKNERVKLHDVIRDMALWIARGCGVENDNKWVVLCGKQVKTAPRDKQTWSEVQKMSLMSTSISTWPSEIQNCPNLTTLILHSNPHLQDNKMNILKHLHAVKYIDLSSCFGLNEFPIEICGLNKLEYLNLSRTSIRSLPEELKNLTNLKYLLLRGNLISTVPGELLSHLVSLLELDLFDSRNLISTVRGNLISTVPGELLSHLVSLLELDLFAISPGQPLFEILGVRFLRVRLLITLTAWTDTWIHLVSMLLRSWISKSLFDCHVPPLGLSVYEKWKI